MEKHGADITPITRPLTFTFQTLEEYREAASKLEPRNPEE